MKNKFAHLSLILVVIILQWACRSKSEFSPSRSAYTGFETREIKALSETEIANYLTGAGKGLAMAAELNGYPGPRHVLDLRSELALTRTQSDKVTAEFNDMHDQAIALGDKIVDAARHIDMMFANAHATSEQLAILIDEAGILKSSLRFVHLNAPPRSGTEVAPP